MSDLKQQVGRPDDEIVADALRVIADNDHAAGVPERIESVVMRAWDARAPRVAQRHRFPAPTWAGALAAAASVVLAAALWVQRPADTVTGSEPATEVLSVDSNEVAGYSLDAIATSGVLLQEDPASLQLVRLSVQPSVLAAFGYPLANPMDTQPLDVEVLIGLDGVPLAIRPVENTGVWSMR